jgi:hypothetical protein
VEVGGGGANGGGSGAIGRWWGLEDGVGNGEKTSVLFIGGLRRFDGKNISPAVGLAGGGSARVPAGFPGAGEVTSRAGRRDSSGRGWVGRGGSGCQRGAVAACGCAAVRR